MIEDIEILLYTFDAFATDRDIQTSRHCKIVWFLFQFKANWFHISIASGYWSWLYYSPFVRLLFIFVTYEFSTEREREREKFDEKIQSTSPANMKKAIWHGGNSSAYVRVYVSSNCNLCVGCNVLLRYVERNTCLSRKWKETCQAHQTTLFASHHIYSRLVKCSM